jgi:hypothetical protein
VLLCFTAVSCKSTCALVLPNNQGIIRCQSVDNAPQMRQTDAEVALDGDTTVAVGGCICSSPRRWCYCCLDLDGLLRKAPGLPQT